MNEQRKLREKAAHARRLAKTTTDLHGREALEAFAAELEQQAKELDGAG